MQQGGRCNGSSTTSILVRSVSIVLCGVGGWRRLVDAVVVVDGVDVSAGLGVVAHCIGEGAGFEGGAFLSF